MLPFVTSHVETCHSRPWRKAMKSGLVKARHICPSCLLGKMGYRTIHKGLSLFGVWVMSYIYIYLEPKLPLFWLEKTFFWRQNKGHLGSRYIYVINSYKPLITDTPTHPDFGIFWVEKVRASNFRVRMKPRCRSFWLGALPPLFWAIQKLSALYDQPLLLKLFLFQVLCFSMLN